MNDPIDHPRHYEQAHPGMECIDLTGSLSFPVGNMVKYVWRHRSKGKPVEDLRKALWYARYAADRQPAIRLDDAQTRVVAALVGQTDGWENLFWQSFRVADWPEMIRLLDEAAR